MTQTGRLQLAELALAAAVNFETETGRLNTANSLEIDPRSAATKVICRVCFRWLQRRNKTQCFYLVTETADQEANKIGSII